MFKSVFCSKIPSQETPQEILRQKQRGFTLVELLVTMTVFLIVLAMGFNFFMRSQQLVKLAESEARMQMYARQAMTVMNKELRQAVNYLEFQYAESDFEASDARFSRPKPGSPGQYIMVRYWYASDAQGLYSLFRAEKDVGNTPATQLELEGFEPNFQSTADKNAYKIRPLIKEATVIDAGKRSFFEQDAKNDIINIHLITATYGYVNGTTTSEVEVKRQFRLDTAVNARNLNSF